MADIQDLLATAHCRLLDTKDDLARRVRKEARSFVVIVEDINHGLVAPLIGSALGRIADGLEYIRGRERTNQSLMKR